MWQKTTTSVTKSVACQNGSKDHSTEKPTKHCNKKSRMSDPTLYR